ncbi:uncharacterized protein MYCFIDRAFT_131203 [Pseudocercospora fijiensis CIRAD86]|uniref:SnoaL-like domain-containing protein n=1 Tax=Pseudocercospora fijiensis (strain CIRAD86) TaxID=383855 RepID=M3A4I0_PSEFD|nr:uncharacterized protein MYCFIDRAFT_131203 [Pseudocercospora fijiensis CIRAD86]EME86024.1 hypothetical protein MYCFIDRAFT_131203 [Pseudocercospora fijiensis CIRAD86]
MHFISLTVAACLAGLADCVDMSRYSARSGVEGGFQAYLKELYRSAEDPQATTGFTDFFTSDGVLKVVTSVATGANEIVALKQKLLPPKGNKHWNHRPNVTSVDSETSTQKTYHVLGAIDTTYDGGNCSRAYYTSLFTVTKDRKGVANLTPHAQNLVKYDDVTVDPGVSPTSIACD